ncbi:MAG: hypothetical protein ABSE97_02990 [Verrucomicrobiota bacterium]
MRKIICLLFCAVMALCSVETLFAQGTAFMYQGRFNDGGSPANGNYDFQFTIYNALTGGSAVSGVLTNSPTAVSNGLFVVTLDFGPGIFTGPSRWLEMGVRTYGDTNAFTVLVPRQQLTPTPYAIFANSASNLVGRLAATQLLGTLPASAFAGYTNTVVLTNGGNLFSGSFNGAFGGTFNGAFYGNGGGVTNVNVTNLTSVLADNQLPANTAFVNSNQTFSGANTFTNWGNSFIGSFFGNGLVGWIPTNGTTVQAAIDRGYLLTNSQLVTVTLPASPNVGDIVRIAGPGASGWRVAQNAGQSIIGNFLSFVKSPWTPSGASITLNWNSIVSSADGSRLAAVASGSGGGIFTSIDSGLTWSGPYGNSGASWRCIASSADGTKLVAAVSGGGIYTNSGTTWQITSAPTGVNWVSVASSADGTKLVAAATGSGVYLSSNSGGTWTQPLGNLNWISVASSADGTKMIAAISGGAIYGNSSGSWAPQFGTPASGSWSSVASSADGSKLVAVATNSGGIYTSVNSGTNWAQTSAPTANWTSVASSSDGSKLAAVVNGGGIYTSSNFGVTWAQQNNAPTKNWSSIASSADGSRLAAAVNSTSNGGIYISQASSQTATTTVGTTGYITGGQGSAVELQYIGNGQFMPVSFAGTIWAY